MQSHFEINVSKDGRHFFATAERSCVTKEDAKKVYDEIRARFPESEGYKVTVTLNHCVGYSVDTNDWKTIYDDEE